MNKKYKDWVQIVQYRNNKIFHRICLNPDYPIMSYARHLMSLSNGHDDVFMINSLHRCNLVLHQYEEHRLNEHRFYSDTGETEWNISSVFYPITKDNKFRGSPFFSELAPKDWDGLAFLEQIKARYDGNWIFEQCY